MIEPQAVTYVELYAHATNTRACDICSHTFHFVLLRFRPSRLIRFVRFRFDPLPRAFSNRCVFDESALRISVDERLKRTEMYLPAKTAVSAAKSAEKQLFSQANVFVQERIKFRALSSVDAFSNENALVCTGPKSFRSPFLTLFMWIRMNSSIKKHIQHSGIMRITPTPLPYLKAIKIVLKFQRHLHVLKDFSVAFAVRALLILCFQNLILSADARKVTATSKMESVLVS